MIKGISIAFLLLTSAIFAQELKSQLLQSEIRIGEQTTFVFSLTYDDPEGNAVIAWPQFSDNLTDDIEIVDQTIDYETLIDSNKSTYLREQKLFLTSFEKGRYEIPPLEIELNDSTYTTKPTYLLVETVEVDTSKGIYDIHNPYKVEYSFEEKLSDFGREYGVWFLLLLIPIIYWGVRKWIKSHKSDESPVVAAPKIPAHVPALAALNRLLKTKAWQAENKKQYYSELTDTVRKYLEDRFSIYAMEQTTREIIQNLMHADISEEDKAYLQSILNQADMVKFAKVKPREEDGETALNKSIDFVKRTMKEE
ncbi:MAG: BatD family protein [Crocinitomicaceae bacterium]|nr:BatD family protein [Crocinitomicaceae bacterium]